MACKDMEKYFYRDQWTFVSAKDSIMEDFVFGIIRTGWTLTGVQLVYKTAGGTSKNSCGLSLKIICRNNRSVLYNHVKFINVYIQKSFRLIIL